MRAPGRALCREHHAPSAPPPRAPPRSSPGVSWSAARPVSPENAGSRAVPSGSPDAAVPPSRLAEKGEEPLGGRGSGSIFLAGRSLLGPWTRGRASVRQDSDIFNSRVSVFLPGDQLTERKGPAGPDQWPPHLGRKMPLQRGPTLAALGIRPFLHQFGTQSPERSLGKAFIKTPPAAQWTTRRQHIREPRHRPLPLRPARVGGTNTAISTSLGTDFQYD